MTKQYCEFPKDFLWGTASASYQVEGCFDQDGRGLSIWDDFSRKTGNVKNGDNGDVAIDQYSRYREDVSLMKSLGLKAYRFSISWSRVLPDGYGKPNEKGMQYYDRLVDELLASDIEPWITFYHWDLPLALQNEYGGWMSRQAADHFADYAALMTKRLSDRVRNFFTMNEFSCFINMGYGDGSHAPGVKLDRKAIVNVRHNALLAHGKGVQAIRANAVEKPNVGIAENIAPPVPVIENEENIEAARKAMRLLAHNAYFITPIMEGAYPDEYLAEMNGDGPDIEPGDMEIISEKLDHVGLNIYFPVYVEAADNRVGFSEVPVPGSYPKFNLNWLSVGPNALYWGPKLVHDVWGVDEICITENGCCCDDNVVQDCKVYDMDRVFYLREYLVALNRAIQEGVPVKAYFLWTLIDNFEWAEGYTPRFGIVQLKHENLARVPKLSSEWYSEVIRRNGLV